jgi:DNA-binding transcriptional ArsR family regulator
LTLYDYKIILLYDYKSRGLLVAKDPLSDLLLDSDEVDRTRLADTLKDILGVDAKTGKIVLKPGYHSLKTRHKVLAYLLGMKVAVLLGKAISEPVLPKDIQDGTGLPKGTVNPKLVELKEAKLVTQDKAGKYYVAHHQIAIAIDDMKGSPG